LEPVDNAGSVRKLIERFRADGPSSLEVDGIPVQYDFAVGTAVYPENGNTILALYEAADAAMYQSKNELEPAKSGPDPD
ncbi:MAG: diguanylate cyclase, partial [Halioglobus sp.]|nr:diguanylate cyclase [Halioglobus sp.]